MIDSPRLDAPFDIQGELPNHATMRTGVIPIAVSIGELNNCGAQAR